MVFRNKGLVFSCFWSLICLPIEGFSKHCSDTGLKSAINGNLTCSFYMDVYVDSQKVGYNENHNTIAHQTIATGSSVIAVKCRCKIPPCGGTILASFDNGLVTDKSWKCTTMFQPGWYYKNFDDSHWKSASSHGLNRDDPLPWGKKDGFSDEAHFIWTLDYNNDHVVYCRKTLVEKCSEVTEAYFSSKERYINHALTDHVMDNVAVDTQLECALRCSRMAGCVSFNLDNSRLKERVCELNGETTTTNPADFRRRNGCDYFEEVKVFY